MGVLIMIIQREKNCSIFFGDIKSCPVGYKNNTFENYCKGLCNDLELSNIVLQHQVHGTNGRYIKETDQLPSMVRYNDEFGDFLITNKPHVGIGVLTADCLPIVFYAPNHSVVAVAHAGWKGSVAGIAEKVITELCKHHKIKQNDLKIFFGACAKPCCYEVQQDFLPNITKFPFHQKLIQVRNGKYYFDVPLLNKLELIQLGIDPSQIDMTQNHCTMCNNNIYHSYRKSPDKENYKAQLTVVWLR
jgi:YfiH family protein